MSRVRQIEIAREGIAHGRFSSLVPHAWSRQRVRDTAGAHFPPRTWRQYRVSQDVKPPC